MKNLKEHKKDWIAEMELTPVELQINRHIVDMDEVATSYEAKWGIGRLPKLVSPEMEVKWTRQLGKVNKAIIDGDAFGIGEQADGFKRGWVAMDAEATRLGHKPYAPDMWEIELKSGFKMRVVKNNMDAMASTSQENTQEGFVTFTLAEVARMIEARYMGVYDVKRVLPGAKVTEIEACDWKKGDSLPF